MMQRSRSWSILGFALLVLVGVGACGDDDAPGDDDDDVMADAAPLEWNCTESLIGCGCYEGNEGDTVSCTEVSVGPGGVCCDHGGSCDCDPIRCTKDSSGCYCNKGLGSPGNTPVVSCAAPAGGTCCKSEVSGLCFCSLADCVAGETQLSSCTVEDPATCFEGDARVASCERP